MHATVSFTGMLFLAAAPPVSLAAQSRPADLIVTHAIVYTADSAHPRAEALAVAGDRIIFVGNSAGATALAGPGATVIDAGGRPLYPGFIDAHAHLRNLSLILATLDLRGVPSYDSVVALVAAIAARTPRGSWIRGRGWDQNLWGTAFPTNALLSRATPDNPVYLRRVDGHAALVNQVALRLAGITRTTPDPPGGRIVRDANGDPTGLLIDQALMLAENAIPHDDVAQMRAMTLPAIAEANGYGLTGIHDAGIGPYELATYEGLARDGRFNLRSYAMIYGGSDTSAFLAQQLALGPRLALYHGHLWLRAIKIAFDGAMGSRGAALLEPYTDDPGNVGLFRIPPDQVENIAVRALRAGFQMATHAIGDRANRVALDIYASALQQVPTPNHRFRIEHAQLLTPQDIPRFAALGVIPSMQGSHQTSDMSWVGSRIGPVRVQWAYAWRSLRDTGVIIPDGSDAPVESINPLVSFHSFITRQNAENEPAGGWFPEQRLSREEALLGMTLWPAFASFMENDVGSLVPGKYADFVILDQDIMAVPVGQILSTRVLRTVLGGETVFERK
jgi:predicted amidohydrolase YtcJ